MLFAVLAFFTLLLLALLIWFAQDYTRSAGEQTNLRRLTWFGLGDTDEEDVASAHEKSTTATAPSTDNSKGKNKGGGSAQQQQQQAQASFMMNPMMNPAAAAAVSFEPLRLYMETAREGPQTFLIKTGN